MGKQTKITDTDQIQSDQERDTKLSKAIMLAIELDSSFKLYSFRIISPEQYQERVNELVSFYKSK